MDKGFSWTQAAQALIDNSADVNKAIQQLLAKHSSGKSIVSMGDTKSPETNAVGYTRDLDYSKGTLNPILQQTVKRIISIDSQYRSDKTTLSSEFTFNLSEPLKDVVSLKLYSVQIPYTWYTIGTAYGNNFFYFKGRTPGITDDLHDILIEIDAGNYSPSELIDTVSESITTAKAAIVDTDLGSTDIVYNRYTSKTKLTADLKKSYNESSFSISFPSWSSPYASDNDRQTIPAFLGLQTDSYSSNTIRSAIKFQIDENTLFTIDNTNNFVRVYVYTGSDPIATPLAGDVSFDISFSLAPGEYNRTMLLNNFNEQLMNHDSLVDSYFQRRYIDESNGKLPPESDLSLILDEDLSLNSFYEMKVKPNRFNIPVSVNTKTMVVFPDVSANGSYLWVDPIEEGSGFGFDVSHNIMNLVRSEAPVIVANTVYTIPNSLSINLTCQLDGFTGGANDLSIVVQAGDYTANEFVSEINNNIRGISQPDISMNAPLANYNLPDNESPDGTYAYIRNNQFQLYLDYTKTFDETQYDVSLGPIITGTTANESNIDLDNITSSAPVITDLTKTYSGKADLGNTSDFKAGDSIATFIFKQDRTITHNVVFDTTSSGNYQTVSNAINTAFANYTDPYSGRNIFQGTEIEYSTQTGADDISFNIQVRKQLVPTNYDIQFKENGIDGANIWSEYFFVDASMASVAFSLSDNNDYNAIHELSGNTLDISSNNVATNPIILSIFNDHTTLISTTDTLPPNTPLVIRSGENDTILINAIENGVASSNGENDITITIEPGEYSRGEIINKINDGFRNYATTTTNISNMAFLIVKGRDNDINQYGLRRDYLQIVFSATRSYSASDYDLVFFDRDSFAKCSVGNSSVRNTTWDTTIGWIMGFRDYTLYELSVFTSGANTTVVSGDTGVSTNLYNYFLICLDDYNQNHLNDGLITVSNTDTSIPLPSYASRVNFTCDPITGQKIFNPPTTNLTENQIYAANEIANAQSNTDSIGSSISTKSYGSGPFVKDVFGLVPIKTSGLANGSTYVEFGGTLQNQERSYFGPVNIQRMSVRLVNDRGELVDLNNANWSFSLICEQLNKLTPGDSVVQETP